MKGGIPALAAAMGRSVSSIKIRATKMHLGPWLNASEFVTLNMLFRVLLGGRESCSYMYIRLLKLGLPTMKRRNQTTQFQMVRIEDFWKWAEAHQRELDFSDFEEGGGWERSLNGQNGSVDETGKTSVWCFRKKVDGACRKMSFYGSCANVGQHGSNSMPHSSAPPVQYAGAFMILPCPTPAASGDEVSKTHGAQMSWRQLRDFHRMATA